MAQSLSLLRSIGTLILTLAALLVASSPAKAANYSWTGTTNATWATATNWSTGITPVAADTATFNAAAGIGGATITTGTISLTTLVFDTASVAAYTIGGATAGTGTITFQNGTTNIVTMNSTVTASQLINANIILGTAIASTSTITNNSTTNTLTFAGNITGGTTGTAAAKTLTFTGTGAITVNGIIAPGGATSLSVTKTGTGTLILTRANTYTGLTTISAGVLRITNNTALGTAAGGVTQTGTSSLQIDGTAGNVTVGAEALSINGGGISNTGALRNIAGNNIYGGTVTMAAQSRINSDAGTLTLNNATASVTGAFTLVVGGAGNVTISTPMTNGAGGVSKDGAGTLTLSGANTFTGAVTVNVGVITVSNATGLGTVAGGVTVASGAALQINGVAVGAEALSLNGTGISNGGALRGLTGTSSYGGAITLAGDSRINTDAGTMTLTGAMGGAFAITVGGVSNTTMTGNIAAAVTSLTKDGVGVLTLTGTNAYSSGSSITAGTLSFVNTTSKPAAGTHAFAAGTTLGLGVSGASAFNPTDVDNAFLGSMVGNLSNVTITGTTNIGIDTTNGSFTYASIVPSTTTSGLTKLGANTLTLSGASTYTTPTSIVNGTLSVGSLNSIVGGSVSSNLGAPTTVSDGTISLGFGLTTGTLSYTGTGETTDRVINLAGTTGGGGIDNSGTGTLTISNPLTFATGAKTLTLSGASNITFSSSISGTISTGTTPLTIVKSGAGTVTLADAGSTATTLTISGGILNTGSGGLTLGNVGAATLNTTGAVVNSTVFVNGRIILTGVATASNNGADIGAIAGVTLDLTNTVIAGTLANANLDFNPAGTVILGNANTYQGQTNFNGSTAVVTSLGTTSGASPSSLGQPAAGNSITGNLYSTILMTNGTLRYVGIGETTDRALDLRGTTTAAILDQSGTGLLKFTSANTAGGAGIKVWTLQGSTIGTGEIAGVIVDNSATNTTGMNKAGTGTWTLSGVNSYTGPTTINGGTLILTTGTTGNSAISINNFGTLSIPANYTIGNSATAAKGGSLTLAVGGILDLSNGAINTLTLTQNATFATAGAAFNGGTIKLDVGGAGADSIVSSGSILGSTATGLNAIVINPIAGFAAGGPFTIIDGGAGTGSINANFFLASSNINVGGSPFTLTLSQTGTTEQLTITAGVSPSAPGVAYWNGTTNSSWTSQPSGPGFATNWVSAASGAPDSFSLPGSTSNVFMSSNTVGAGGLTTTIDGVTAINSLTFTGTGSNNTAGSIINVGTGTSLSINAATVNGNASGNGITVLAGSGANTINVPIILGASQTWTTNASNSTTFSNVVSGTGMNLTVTGAGTGGFVFSNSANTYDGITTINGSVLSIPTLANGGLPSSIGQSSNDVANLVFGGTSTLQYTGSSIVIDRNFTINAGVNAILDITQVGTTLELPGATGPVTTGLLTKTGPGTLTLSGANTYTGNTVVSAGILNITGSLTGIFTPAVNPTSGSALRYGDTAGKTIVNISGNVNSYFVFTGANIAGSVAVMNQTAGNVTIVPRNGGDDQFVANNGGYGMLNITGGNFNTGRFDGVGATTSNASTAVIYVGSSGTLNQNTGDWFLPIRNNGMMTMTVAPGGTFIRQSAVTAQFSITGLNNAAGSTSYGVFNVAGGTVDTGTKGINFSQGTFQPLGTNVGFVNLAGGTLSVGLNTAVGAAVGLTTGYFNFAGGTLRATAAMTSVIPVSTANYVFTSTVFGGSITNNNNANIAFNTQIGSTSNFTGGMTVDTNGFAVGFANALLGATGTGVTQANIGDVSLLPGNSGYIGAPMVQFAAPALGGVPATGYAVIDTATGKVNGIVITNPGTYASGETPLITLTGGGGTIAPFNASGVTTANISGGLNKIGLGTLTLSGNNTYTGGTTVTVGTLALGVNNALAGTGNVTVNGATFDIATFTNTVGTVTLDNGGTITGSSGVLTSDDFQLKSGTVSAILTSTLLSSTVTKTTAGTVTLSGANTFTGPITVNGGLVAFANSPATSGPLGNNTNINLSGGGISYTGSTTNVLNKIVAIGSSNGTVDVANSLGVLTISSITSNGGNLIKTGPGTAQITSNTTLNGGLAGVVVNGGTLNAGFGTSGISSINVSSTGALNLTNTAPVTLTLTGGLTLASGAKLGFALGSSTPSIVNDQIVYNTASVLSGSNITLNFTNFSNQLGAGSYILLDSSTTGQLTGVNFLLGSAPAGFNYTITNDGTKVSLLTTAYTPIFWNNTQGDGSWSNVTGNSGSIGAGAGTNFTTSISGATDAGHAPLPAETVIFNTSAFVGPTITTTLDGSFTIDSLQFNGSGTPAVTSVTINQGTSGILTLKPLSSSGGILIASGGGNATIAAPLVLNNTLSTGQTWSVIDATSTLLISGNVTFGANVTKTGAGVLTLSGTNSGSGAITLTAGTININSPTALGSGTLSIAAGTTIDSTVSATILTTINAQNWNGSFTFTGTQDLNLFTGAVTMSNSLTVTTGTANKTLTIGGSISGSGFSLTKDGAGTLVLNGNNTYSGLTTVSAGILTLGGANTGAGGLTLSAGTLNINSAGALGTGTLTIATGTTINNTSGSAIPTSTNNPAQAWNGSFTFTGSSDLNLGTGGVTLTSNPTVTLTSGTLTVGGNFSGASTLTITGAGNLVLGGNLTQTGNVTLSGTGTITTNGNLAQVGGTTISAGTVIMNGTGTYTAATTINGGTLRLGSATALPSANAVTMSGTSTLDLFGNSATIGAFTSVATSTLTNSSLSTGVSTATAPGTPTGANVYVDALTVTPATAAVVPALITDGATRKTQLVLNNANAATQMTGNTANTYSGGLVLAHNPSGTRLAVGTITGTPWGAGPIIIGQTATDKAGIYFATATQTMTNPIVFNTALGTDRVGIRSDVAGITLSGVITANLAPATFTSNTAAGVITLTNQVTGTFGLVLDIVSLASASTAFTVTLNNGTANPNNYQGDTVINFNAAVGKSATLALGQANQIPNGAGTGNVIINTNGTGIGRLNLAGFSDTINGLSGSGTLDGTSGTPTLTLGDNNANGFTFSGIISNSAGNLAVTKIGTGIQTFSGANTFSGATIVSAGILTLTNSLALQNSPLDTLNSIAGNATNGLQTTETALTLGGLTGSKNLADVFATAGGYNTLAALTLNPVSGATPSYSGVIANGAAGMTLIKSGAGTQTLTGANTYDGTTIVNAGVLSAPTLANGGLASTIGQSSNAAANLVFGGTGTLQYTGGSTSIDRNFTINAGSTATFDVTQVGTTLELPGATGPVTTGALTKVGPGTLILSGVNTYTGTTTIGDGILRYTAATQTLGGLTFGLTAASTTVGTLDLSTASVTFAGAATVQTNTTNINTILIGNAQTLTLNSGLTVGYVATAGTATNTNLSTTGTGSLVVNGTNLIVGVDITGTANSAWFNRATLDVSSLTSFSTNVTNFNIGSGTISAPTGNVILSDTANTILATTLVVGNTGANNGNGGSTLTLGTGTNVLQVDTIRIGRGKGSGPGTVKFASQLAGPGTVTITNKAGTGAADIDIANLNGTGTAGGAVGTLDLRGHMSTVTAGTITMANNNNSSTGGTTAIINFDTGTLTVTTLNMAPKTAAGVALASATINLSGGSFTVNSGGSVTLGTQATAGTSAATLNVTGGTFTSNVNILDGGGATTSTITLNGGTLDLNGNTIGSATAIDILNFQAGTLKNVAEINNGGAISKTTAGTLILEGTNTYSGITTISGGVLQVGSGSTTGTLGTGNITNDSVLAFNRSNAYTVSNIIGGIGAVNQIGTGTTIITASNSYSGATNVNAGELRVNTPGSIGSNTAVVTVASGATLSGTGTVFGPVTVQTGGTIRGDSGTGTGTLTFGVATPASTSSITGGIGSTGATLATYLPTGPTPTITGNSLIAIGANILNLDSTGGKFNILLLNDGGLTGQAYTVTLATSAAGTFNRNGTPYDAGTNAFNSLTDFTVVSGSGLQSYDPNAYSLSVQSNNLVLNFTPSAVPEPATILGLACAGLGLSGWVRRRRNAKRSR